MCTLENGLWRKTRSLRGAFGWYFNLSQHRFGEFKYHANLEFNEVEGSTWMTYLYFSWFICPDTDHISLGCYVLSFKTTSTGFPLSDLCQTEIQFRSSNIYIQPSVKAGLLLVYLPAHHLNKTIQHSLSYSSFPDQCGGVVRGWGGGWQGLVHAC